MRFFVGDAQLGQKVKNHIGLDLELAGQLVYADFTHTMAPQRIVFQHQGFSQFALLGPEISLRFRMLPFLYRNRFVFSLVYFRRLIRRPI